MSEVATFFRHRDEDPGETYRIDVGSSRFYAYSRKEIQRNLRKQVAERKEPSAAEADLRTALKSGGGGVMVKVTEDMRQTSVDVEWFGMKGFAPERYVVLSPGRPARFDDGQQRLLPAGSHVIVPVDQDAEQALASFVGHLAWLSPDLETLVLNSIRRPSLDARLSKVEQKMFGASESGSGGSLKNAWPAVLIGFVSALILGVAGYSGWQLFKDRPQKGTEEVVNTGTVAGARTDTVADTKPPAWAQNGTPADETRVLMQHLRAKQASDADSDFGLLYKNHFEGVYKDDLTDAQIAALFDKAKNQPFVWGLIKLQALKLQPGSADRAFLTGWEEITHTKTRFTQIGIEDIKRDTAGLRLLAALSCRLGYDTPTAPGLPQISTGPAFEFVPGGKCADFNSVTEIEKGLAGLIAFVEPADD